MLYYPAVTGSCMITYPYLILAFSKQVWSAARSADVKSFLTSPDRLRPLLCCAICAGMAAMEASLIHETRYLSSSGIPLSRAMLCLAS